MIRRAIVALALAAATFVVIPAGPAQARVCAIEHVCTYVYYSDASMQSVVGALTVGCGYYSLWGTQTSHFSFYESPC